MKNKICLLAIILIVFVLNIFPQQIFRSAAYLSQSIGTHIYWEGLTTNVPLALADYNTTNGYEGDNAFTIYNPTDDYPSGGNQMWNWQKAFYDSAGYSFKEDYLDTDTYNIIMVKFCAASQSAIWFYWHDGPQDTINYPETQSTYNYQWYIRKIVRKMEEYPNKFFFLWNVPSATEQEGTPEDMVRLNDFNLWMTDTLQAGLDSYGTFPPNVKIFDFFNLLKSPYSNYMDSIYRHTPDDYHPNALASSVVAPILVQRMFDAAIYYENNYPLPVELSAFSATIIGSSVRLNWRTETETNNYGFEVERKSDVWEKIGFVKGNGNSNSPRDYVFNNNGLILGQYSYRLKQIDNDGQFEYSKTIEVDFGEPKKFELSQNYPNPFNPKTTIRFSLPEAGNVKLTVFNILGQEIKTLVNEFKESGKHITYFDANGLNSDIYYYKLESGAFVQTKKMMLLK